MKEDEIKVIDDLITANLLVTTTKDAVAEAKHAHREAVKKAALAKAAYEELLLKRLEACDATQ